MKNIIKFFYLIFLLCSSANALGATEVVEREIIIKNHKFEPDIIEVQAGVKIRLTIHNRDSTIEEFDSPDLKREKIIPGNSTAYIVLAPLKPGKYFFMGEFHASSAKGYLVIN